MALSHRKLSAWYHQLAQQTEAGLPFAQALRSSRGTGMPAAALEKMAGGTETGGSIESAFASAERWLPLPDRVVLTAAAEAGRMPHVLRSLSLRHAQLGAAKLRLLLACVYPLGVLHVGLLLLPIVRMIDWEKGFAWNALVYARTLALTVVPLWIVIIGLVMLARHQNPILARIARSLPFIGGYTRAQGLSDFAFVLGNFLDAGVRIDRAWTVAGSVTTRPDLRRSGRGDA